MNTEYRGQQVKLVNVKLGSTSSYLDFDLQFKDESKRSADEINNYDYARLKAEYIRHRYVAKNTAYALIARMNKTTFLSPFSTKKIRVLVKGIPRWKVPNHANRQARGSKDSIKLDIEG